MSHPHMEDYVVLPTRPAMRIDDQMIGHDTSYKLSCSDPAISRRDSASWINTLMEKHAGLSAGLIWLPSASDAGTKGEYSNPKSDEPESRPTINLFERWEDGSQLVRAVSARDYHFSMCFVVPFMPYGPVSKRRCGRSCSQLNRRC